MSETGKFFQLDRNAFHAACNVGLNAAVAYIFLACGTDESCRTSTWSTHSIEKYTGLGRGQAKRAIEQLIDAGLVTQLYAGRGITGRYELVPASAVAMVIQGMKADEVERLAASEPDWIWLPNTLVTGAQNEVPPIERIRRSQDVRILKLLVELYHVHELADRGGLPWHIMCHLYERRKVTERGTWNIWEFTSKNADQVGSLQARNWFKTDLEGNAIGADAALKAFWNAWHIIKAAGLVERVDHLVDADSEDGAIIYPCPYYMGGTDAEQQVGQAARDAAINMLGETMGFVADARGAENESAHLPVDRAYTEVQMVGVYRLIYRPRTNMTAAWHARQFEYEKMAEGFRALAANALEGIPLQNRIA